MNLSVVIPVYNEVDNVAPLVEEVHAALADRISYEMIVVDDGSHDETVQRLRELGIAHPRLRVMSHAKNCGQSAAILTGVRAARAAWVATLDGDGQNDPADIPRLLAIRDDPATSPEVSLITGYRRERHDTWLRRLSSRVANGVRSRMLKDEAPDTGCGLKLFRREAFLAIPHFDHMHRFLPALIRRDGGVVINVEVNHRPRRRGVSKYGLFDRLWVGVVDLLGVMWLRKRKINASAKETVK